MKMGNTKLTIIMILSLLLIVFCAMGQDPLWKKASMYEEGGYYSEAIIVLKQMAKDDNGTEWYLDDIAGIARCYSYTNQNDSTIKYCNLANELAGKLINVSDSVAEVYIQNSAWSLYRCGEYNLAVESSRKVLALREKMHGFGSHQFIEWIGAMSYEALKQKDLAGIENFCNIEIRCAEESHGIHSQYYEDAISTIRAYAHNLISECPQFVTKWIRPFYERIKSENILLHYQYEFEILQLEGFLSIGNLKSADAIARILQEWTLESKKRDVPLEDRVRIWLKLANYDMSMGNLQKARWRLMESDKSLAEESGEMSLAQLIDRHIVERNLRMDPDGNPQIYSKWLIETSIPIITKGSDDKETLAFFYASRAWAYEGLGEYDKAIDDINKAISLNPLYSHKKKLAQLYMQKKDFKSAESIYVNLLTDNSMTGVGKESIEADLVFLYWAMKDKQTLASFMSKDLTNLKSDVRRAFAFMNEYEREIFISQSLISGSIYYDIYTSFSKDDDQWAEGNIKAYDLALIQKGLLLETTQNIDNILRSNSEKRDKVLEYLKLRDYVKNLAPSAPEDSYIRELRLQLMPFVEKHPDFLKQMNITWNDIRANLKESEVAVEFILLSGILSDDFLKSSQPSAHPFLGALIVKGDSPYPIFVKLGSILEINSLFKVDEEGVKLNDEIYSGYAKRNLYSEIWLPIEKYLKDVRTVYYSPTGVLHEINLDFIGANDNDFLGLRYNLHRLSSTRELCNRTNKYNHNDAILYGNISYSNVTPEITQEKGLRHRANTRFGFSSLNGTAVEIDSIKSHLYKRSLPTQVYVKSVATEESFREMSGNSPHILHMATHGFFYTIDNARKDTEVPNFIAFQSINPELYHSGLALAGAQDSWTVSDLNQFFDLDQNNDGIILSAEIANLDFSKTDLVVLSACETALGNITSEGVYGLQRAFKLSGVNSIIMSLWKVDDDASQIIMTNFYNNYLNGMSKRESLIKAQLSLREKAGFKDPYFWAAFVLLDGIN